MHMLKEVIMPQLGESVTEGTLEKWLVQEGDYVNQYDPLCEVMTDKVNAEVPSTYSGYVSKIVVAEGETVKVGTLICYIKVESETSASVQSDNPWDDSSEDRRKEGGKGEQSSTKREMYSPVVRRLAREHAVPLEKLQGTGKNGRITRNDVLQWIRANQREMGDGEQGMPLTSLDTGHTEIIPLSSVQRAIANKMVLSKTEIPHAWTMMEVDVTKLVQFREKRKESFKRETGVNLTYLPFFIRAAAEALKRFPQVNSQWAGDKIIYKKEINISISVATEEALYVPVIKHADRKSVVELAKEIHDLTERTRAGKLTPKDVEGGTFTVNNIGSFGTVLSQPIINYPQAAILSIEAITPRVVVIDGMIAIRQMVNLCLSLDHRILDGLISARFLKFIKDRMEAMGEEKDLVLV